MLLILFAAIGNYSSPRGQWASAGKGNKGGWEGGSRPVFTLTPCHPYYFTVFLVGRKNDRKSLFPFWTAVKNKGFPSKSRPELLKEQCALQHRVSNIYQTCLSTTNTYEGNEQSGRKGPIFSTFTFDMTQHKSSDVLGTGIRGTINF